MEVGSTDEPHEENQASTSTMDGIGRRSCGINYHSHCEPFRGVPMFGTSVMHRQMYYSKPRSIATVLNPTQDERINLL